MCVCVCVCVCVLNPARARRLSIYIYIYIYISCHANITSFPGSLAINPNHPLLQADPLDFILYTQRKISVHLFLIGLHWHVHIYDFIKDRPFEYVLVSSAMLYMDF